MRRNASTSSISSTVHLRSFEDELAEGDSDGPEVLGDGAGAFVAGVGEPTDEPEDEDGAAVVGAFDGDSVVGAGATVLGTTVSGSTVAAGTSVDAGVRGAFVAAG